VHNGFVHDKLGLTQIERLQARVNGDTLVRFYDL